MDDNSNHSIKHSTSPRLNFINGLSDKALSRTLGFLEGREKKAAASVCKKWNVILHNNDFLYYPLGYQEPVCHYLKIIGAEEAHQKEMGEGVKIAIIDCGWFDCNGDTKDAITQSTKDRLSHLKQTYENKNHANFVASIIHSIAPKAQLEVFTPASEDYGGTDQAWEEWCSKTIHQVILLKVDFINMSIGWREKECDFPPLIAKALCAARDAKIGTLIAASNDNVAFNSVTLGENMYKGLGACLKEMGGYTKMVVGTAYSREDLPLEPIGETFYRYSNNLSAECINHSFAAPGQDILSFGVASKEGVWSGTSASTAMATGAAASVKSQARHLNPAEVFSALDQSARKIVLHPITKEQFIKLYASVHTRELLTAYERSRRSSSRGRGGLMNRGTRSKTMTFDEYVESRYQDEIKLPSHRFGQGVIYIPSALKWLEQQQKPIVSENFQ